MVATKMMADYGFFSQVHPGTKLKIVGMNSYLSDFTNLYLWGNSTDPYGFVQSSVRE
ncbi:MAG: hypothetical protein P4M11_10405 [Candidatus Pacebacteria bacterium]|nr:hypothetical protein [Candidatus Paceibacterota bacterium]